MRIEVRRSGGFAGTTRRWRVDTDTSGDPAAWSEVVDALPLTGTGRVQKGRLRGIERRRLDGLLG